MSPSGERSRLVFESSDGVTVLYGNGACALELLESFNSENLYFGDPPYRFDVRNVPEDLPLLTIDDFREGDR